MKYGDLSSIVQLGVGLHVGTALLQFYGELGVQRLVRTIARVKSLFTASDPRDRPSEEIKDELEQLEARYEVFKIELFNEYIRYVKINSAVAFSLAIILIAIACKADDVFDNHSDWKAVLIIALSLVPAPLTLAVLAWDANHQLAPMKNQADNLERRAQAGQ